MDNKVEQDKINIIQQDIKIKLFDVKLDTQLQLTPVQNKISDRELLRVVKEEKRFPIPFSRPVKLGLLLKFYHKYWNNDFTDEDSDYEE